MNPESILHALNPFSPGAGLQPRELVGRKPELEHMDTVIARTKAGYTNRGLIFSGLRGVGKTVLLLRMMEMAGQQGIMTARMEATGQKEQDRAALLHSLERAVARKKLGGLLSDIRSVLQHVQSIGVETPIASASIDLQRQLTDTDFEIDLAIEDITRDCVTHNSGLFLFIDEFQEMDSALMGTLIGLQHRLGQEALPFYIIGAGLPNLPGTLTASRSYAERLFEYRTIGRLDDDAAVTCFQETAAQSGRSFTDEAVSRLVQDSQGYPYFIQAYGEAAFNASDSSPIPLKAVEIGEHKAISILDQGLYESRWQRSTKLGRRYMYAMASLGEEECDSSAVAHKMGRSARDLTKARHSLIELGLIYAPERGKVAFTVPGMAAFIQRTEPKESMPYDKDDSSAS